MRNIPLAAPPVNDIPERNPRPAPPPLDRPKRLTPDDAIALIPKRVWAGIGEASRSTARVECAVMIAADARNAATVTPRTPARLAVDMLARAGVTARWDADASPPVLICHLGGERL